MKRFVCIAAIALLAGCGRSSDTNTSTTVTSAAPAESAAPSESAAPQAANAGTGTMHVVVTGPNATTMDFTIKGCMLRKPGRAITQGLAVTSDNAASGVLKGAQVDLNMYDHDGSYTLPGQDAIVGPVTLLFRKNVQVVETKASHTSAVVKDGGKSGTLTFSNWQDFDSKAPVSGSIVWSCATIFKSAI